MTNRRGFTLIEVLIVVVIVAILASVVVPQFNASSEEAKDARLIYNLSILRKQIELFKTQHNGNAPGWSSGFPMAHLLFATDALGNFNGSPSTPQIPDATHPFGAYLQDYMPNPFNGGTTFKASLDPANETPDESLVNVKTVGWFYDANTGRIAANAEGNTASGKPRISL